MQTDTQAFAEFLRADLTPENRGRLEHLLVTHFGAQPDITPLLDLVLNGDLTAIYAFHPQGHDRVFLAALVALVQSCKLQQGAAYAPAPKRIRSINAAYDFFHAIRDEANWSLIRCMNFLYRAKLRPRKRIAIVTCIRDEGINIIEWLAHHRLMGIDDFIIYANDNSDGSSGLLQLLAEHGIIHLIWNSVALPHNPATMFPIQAKAYGHACEILAEARDFRWLMFADMDEFLITRPVFETPEMPKPLDDLFMRITQIPSPPDAISFNWKWFTSECEFRRRPGLNFERFRHYVGSDYLKTMVRADRCLSFSTSHRPRLPAGGITFDGALQPVAGHDFRMQAAYDYGQINHYWNKSFEEFIGRYLRMRGKTTIPDFFISGNNRHRGNNEAVPDTWIARLHAEIKALTVLPGIAAEIANIEQDFTEKLAAFDREHGTRALFDKYF